MARKLTRWLILTLGVLLLVAIVGGGALYWRLQQGPIALPMVQPRVQAALAGSLREAGMRADFRDVVIEIDKRRRLPTLRLRDLVLHDRGGGELLRAPRAAFTVAMADLLRGRPRVRDLELVGPLLTLRRNADGHFTLGSNHQPSPRAHAPRVPWGKNKTGAAPSSAGKGLLHDLLQVLRSQGSQDRRGEHGAAGAKGASPLGMLRSISISRAEIRYRDDILGLNLQLPDTELSLRQVPYGYALMASGKLHGLGEKPLPMEMNAAWRQATERISVSLQTQGLRLGRLLSVLLGVSLRDRLVAPASARISADIDGDGTLTRVAGEMLLGAGRISFPDWLAHTVHFREGVVRLDYAPASRVLRITQGELLHAEGRTRLSGTVKLSGGPDAGQGLHARSLQLDLDLNHAARGAGAHRALLRRITLDGEYLVASRQLRIDDLQFFGGGAAMRLRGMIRAEAEGMGLYVSGRAHDISHEMLKQLWPPRLGTGARQWLHENVSGGHIPRATMRLALPAKVIRAAVEHDVPMPDEVADIRFQVRDARFSYVEGWPDVRGVAGEGELRGNTFRLTLTTGFSRLPSGKVLKLKRGELRARELAAKVSPGHITVQAEGSATGIRELIDSPPLHLYRQLGIARGELKGRVSLNTRLRLSFRRGMTGDDVSVEHVRAKIDRAEVLGLVKGLDLRQGRFDVIYEKGLLKAEGDARLDGLPVRLSWQRPVGTQATAARPLLRIRARLSDAQRRKLGVDLAPWLSGPLQLEMETPGDSPELRRLHLRVGLDAVSMQLPAIGWRRSPRKGTKASLDLVLTKGGGARISKLRLEGPGGLRIRGEMTLDDKWRLRSATFSRFELNANNRLALGVQFDGRQLSLAAAGPVFDARALIARLFAPRREIDRALPSVFVRVNLERVLALRGEYIENVRGEVEMRHGLVRRASLTGNFPNGRKVVLDLAPAADGLRRLRIVSDDAGALLRASDLYSRVQGGRAEFTALLKGGDDGGVQRGLLVMRKFMVSGDQRLSRLQQRGNAQRNSGPRRRKGQKFKKLVLPFSTDSRFIRIGDAIIRSPEIGATANGMIRRADGAMDIGGVIIPAYALNAAFGKIPILGALLTGGKGQGVFGMTYALKGRMDRPKFIVNPLSAVAPGVFRQLFHIGGQNVNPDGTARRRGQSEPPRLRRNNLVNGG